MKTPTHIDKNTIAYAALTALVVCGLAASLITAVKLTHFTVDFPFSNLVFSIFTYPVVDCICEIWGRQAARQSLYFGLAGQALFACLIQFSIIAPASPNWVLQSQYIEILGVSTKVVVASLLAFSVSQWLDIFVYQRVRGFTQGKHLWLRSNLSTILGQIIDSVIFVSIVFTGAAQLKNVIVGSLLVKIILSLLMTPAVYALVFLVNIYLNGHTLAFKTERSGMNPA